MKIAPLQNRVLIKRKKAEEVSKNGIIIPSTIIEKTNEGEVLAVGRGRLTTDGEVIPMTVKPGEKVMFNRHAGSEIKLDGETYLLMSEDDIIAVFE
jgi:chaperonin GroES